MDAHDSNAFSSDALTAMPAELDARPVQSILKRSPRRRLWRHLATLFFSLASFLLVFVIAAFALPHVLSRVRAAEARAEADAAYQKRRAELRAESDAAEEHLKLLDKRVDLVSLGFREVVRKVSPCVVNLTSYADKPDAVQRKEWPQVLDPDTGKKTYITGAGSGVIVAPGWVLTNYHVVASANRLRVTFASGLMVTVPEEHIKIDPLTDLAAIQLPAADEGMKREDNEFNVEFGNSDAVERGDLVLAIGNPLGLKHTVTHGIISAKGRLLSSIDINEVLQTDAPINKGNSGGPLFDHRGRMVGINFAIASDTGFSQGIGFAIPSNIAKEVFEQLKATGEVVRGYLGVELAETPLQQAAKWTKSGAVQIGNVLAEHAGNKAGLQPGDLIVAYNGEALSAGNAVRHLRQLIMDTKVGQQAQLDIIRAGQRLALEVTIGKRPPEPRKMR